MRSILITIMLSLFIVQANAAVHCEEKFEGQPFEEVEIVGIDDAGPVECFYGPGEKIFYILKDNYSPASGNWTTAIPGVPGPPICYIGNGGTFDTCLFERKKPV